MPRRSAKPTTVNITPVTDRFRSDDIVRAIEAVEQTGLTVRGVEITTNGSIKIDTVPRDKAAAASVKPAEFAPPAKKQS
jgi:hypothetical protein